MTSIITVELHRDTIDPERIATDEDVEDCRFFIVAVVREMFPHADVRLVRSGGRRLPAGHTSGIGANGENLDREVNTAVQQAWDAYHASAGVREVVRSVRETVR